MRRRAVIGSGLAALAGCSLASQRSWTIRYRLDVHTESPALRASSVIETRYRGPAGTVLGLPSTYLYRTQTWGDAPSFETPNGGRLFAMFSRAEVLAGNGEHLFAPTNERTLVSVLSNADDMEAYREGRHFDELIAITGVHDLPPRQFPRLIWLEDENDLSTARFVPLPDYNYENLGDTPQRRLADVLGPDANVTRVTIERVETPITLHLHQRLAWLNGMNGDDGALVWQADRPFWANLLRQYFALRGEDNDMT